MTAPLVSVVIPAYNAGRWIGQAVNSVLAQDWRPTEIIVVDDGSTDDTSSVVSSYGSAVRCVGQPNGGVSLARNRGMAESQGAFIAFLDADDAWLPTKLARQMAALQQQPECAAAYTAVVEADEALRDRCVKRSHDGAVSAEGLLRAGNIVTGSASSVICERRLIFDVGGFDPTLSLCADWDLWLRLAVRTCFAYVDEPLVRYRRTPSSMSRSVPVLERDTLAILERAFADERHIRLRRAVYGHHYAVLSGSYLEAGERIRAVRCLCAALKHDPRQLFRVLAMPSRRWRAWRTRVPRK